MITHPTEKPLPVAVLERFPAMALIPSPGLDPLPALQVHNFAAKAHVGTELDLKTVMLRLRNAEWNPQGFANAAIVRFGKGKGTVKVFRSGALTLTGGKTLDGSRRLLKKVAKLLRYVGAAVGGKEVVFRGFEVTNIVAGCDLGFPVALEDFASTWAGFVTYEPELRSRAKWEFVKEEAGLTSCAVFVSGKVQFFGGTRVADIEAALEDLYPVLREFRKRTL